MSNQWKVDLDKARELLQLEEELKARQALKDVYFWVTQCTKTSDEQDPLHPHKPFPEKPWFKPIYDVLDNEPNTWIYKSRTMMETWQVSSWAAHKGFTIPVTGVVFQSQDEDRSVHCIECVKDLWENSLPRLKKRWPLSKKMENQPYNKLEMANGSWFLGIPGDPNKLRSAHPTIVVFDEAAFMLRGEEAYNVAVASRAPHIIALSSAEEGFMNDKFLAASPVDWPDYEEAA